MAKSDPSPPWRESGTLTPMDRPLRKVLVLQHVPHEPLGTLDRLLRQHKIRIKFVNFSRDPQATPDIAGYDPALKTAAQVYDPPAARALPASR